MAGWEVFDIDSDEAKVALDLECEIPVGRSPDSASLENSFRSRRAQLVRSWSYGWVLCGFHGRLYIKFYHFGLATSMAYVVPSNLSNRFRRLI